MAKSTQPTPGVRPPSPETVGTGNDTGALNSAALPPIPQATSPSDGPTERQNLLTPPLPPLPSTGTDGTLIARGVAPGAIPQPSLTTRGVALLTAIANGDSPSIGQGAGGPNAATLRELLSETFRRHGQSSRFSSGRTTPRHIGSLEVEGIKGAQRLLNLTPDGVVGPATARAMYEYLYPAAPPLGPKLGEMYGNFQTSFYSRQDYPGRNAAGRIGYTLDQYLAGTAPYVTVAAHGNHPMGLKLTVVLNGKPIPCVVEDRGDESIIHPGKLDLYVEATSDAVSRGLNGGKLSPAYRR